MMENKKLSLLRGMAPAVFVSVAACFLMCVYAPLELYLGNQNEFWFKLGDMLPTAWVMFIVCTALCSALLLLLKKLSVKIYRVVLVAAFGIFICFYAEGNFLAGNLPPLDGTAVDFGAYPAERIKCVLLWLLVAAVLAVLWKKLGSDRLVRICGYVGLGLFGVLALTAAALRLTTPLKDDTAYDLVFTEKDKYVMSSDRNLIIFSMDAVSADAFERVLDKYPEYREAFTDFRYFDDTLCAYPFTSRSLPFTLTGEWFENREPFQEYQNRSYGTSRLLNRLWDEDYDVGIYLPDYQLSADLYEGTAVNCVRESARVRSPFHMAVMIVKMSMLKYAPWDLKYYSYNIPYWNSHIRVVNNADSFDYYDYMSLPLYGQLSAEDPITVTEDKCFKFIHFEGGHVPFSLNNDMEEVENGSYDEKVASALHIAALYLRRLKESGVYDNSAIIITADHGYREQVPGEKYSPATRRFNPPLLIKGVGETHPEMQTDGAPISFADLQEAYQRLLDGKDSSQVFDWHEGDRRERRCLLYYYLEEKHMREFVTTGDAGDADSLHETGVVFDYAR